MTWKIATAKKGQRSPPPLPMYERVVLKHVPTMVRRRYDRDLNIIDEDQEKAEDDEAEDLDDSFDDYEEAEDDTFASLDTEYDSPSIQRKFGGNNIESSSSSCLKDCEDGRDGAKDEDHGEASVGNEAHGNEHDCKSEGEGAEDANISVQGEIQDMGDQNYDDKQVDNYLDSKERKEEDDRDDRANDALIANCTDTSVINDGKEIEKEDYKSEGDEIEDNQSQASEYKDGSVQGEVQGNQHVVNFDNQQGSCIEIYQSEGDGFKDVNGASDNVDANLSNDAQDKEQGSSDEDNNEKITLSFGKEYSPAPLPMYERVLLKHVPTTVRRRYDKDINKFDAISDLAEEDVKSEGDGGEDFLPSTTSSDVDDDSGDDEACTKATLTTKHDTQIYEDDSGQPNDKFGSSAIIQSEEIKSEDGVENDQASYSKDVEEDDDTAREVNLANDVDTSIKTEPEHSEKGLQMEDCKTKVGGTKDNAVAADIDKIDTRVENEVKHNEHGNDGSKQGSYSKDVEVVEDDGAADMNLASDVDASVKNEAEHDEQGLHVEDCESKGGVAKDVNDVSSYNVDECVKQEVLEKGHLKEHENLDSKQGLRKESCERRGDGSKNTNDIICNKNVSIQEEVWENQGHGHFGSKQDTTITLFRNLFNNLINSNLPSFPSISWRATRLIQVKWNPPPINFHKLDFDGPCTPSLVVLMGVVIRDSHGSVISAKTYNMIKPTTPIVAEAMAINKGLLQLGLCYEGDKQSTIIRSIYRDYQFPWNLQFLVDVSSTSDHR